MKIHNKCSSLIRPGKISFQLMAKVPRLRFHSRWLKFVSKFSNWCHSCHRNNSNRLDEFLLQFWLQLTELRVWWTDQVWLHPWELAWPTPWWIDQFDNRNFFPSKLVTTQVESEVDSLKIKDLNKCWPRHFHNWVLCQTNCHHFKVREELPLVLFLVTHLITMDTSDRWMLAMLKEKSKHISSCLSRIKKGAKIKSNFKCNPFFSRVLYKKWSEENNKKSQFCVLKMFADWWWRMRRMERNYF